MREPIIHLGNTVYMNGGGESGEALLAFDITNPLAPEHLSSWNLAGPPHYLAVSKGIAFVSTEFDLELIDTNMAKAGKQPVKFDFTGGLGRAAGMDSAAGVAVSKDICCICHNKNGMMIFNIKDINKPILVSSFKSRNVKKPMSVAISGNYAFLGDFGCLVVVDISDPGHPREVTALQISGAGEKIIVEDDILYMACGNAGLQVIDVHNPTKPVVIDSVKLIGRAFGVALDANNIYIAAGQGGMYILNKPGKSGSTGKETSTRRNNTDSAVKLDTYESFRPDEKTSVTSVSQPATGQIHNVTSTGDNGSGSLRQALESSSYADVIVFDPAVFPTAYPAIIRVKSPLPFLDKGRLTIDASNAGVIMDGSDTQKGTNGLVITADYNTIMGLQVAHFPGAGIGIAGGSFNVIGGSRKQGTGPSGEGNTISGNVSVGIGIVGSISSIATDIGAGKLNGVSKCNRYFHR